MDNLTHSLFGLTLARTPLCRAGRGTTAALLLASNAPDIDFVVTARGGAAGYLDLHRGPTHGLLGVAGLALVVATLVWLWQWRRDRGGADPRMSFLAAWGVGIVGVLCHILMDLPTSYGTRPLSPFSWTWFAVDWMPIVDVYLLCILGAGLWLGRRGPSHVDVSLRRYRLATAVLSLMALDYAVRAVAHQTAIQRAASAFGDRLPAWCEHSARPDWAVDWWPRLPDTSPRDRAAAHCLVEIAATPSFTSPFEWRLIAQLSNGYELRDVNVITGRGFDGGRGSSRPLPVHVSNQWTPVVAHAARARSAQVFLRFSRFPAVRSTIDAGGRATVVWTDMRFTPPGLDDGPQARRGLFGATVAVAPDGSVVSDRLGP